MELQGFLMPSIWIKFLIHSLGLFFFGYFSSKYAAIIAKRSRISEGFMGVFFLAVATSAPEIITSGVAVKGGFFDLAIGDICGSLLVNLFILIALDLFVRRSFFRKEFLSGNLFLVFLLQFILLAAIFMRNSFNFKMGFLNFGFENFLIIFLYFLFLKRENLPAHKYTALIDKKNIKPAKQVFNWTVFILSLTAIAFFGRLIISDAKVIVEKSSLNYVFFGTLFLGFVTSLPEAVVAISAVFNKSYAMAVGNILGSNALDIAIVPILDVITRNAPVLSMVSPSHIVSICFLEFVVVLLFVLVRVKRKVKLYELLLLLLLAVPLLIIF